MISWLLAPAKGMNISVFSVLCNWVTALQKLMAESGLLEALFEISGIVQREPSGKSRVC